MKWAAVILAIVARTCFGSVLPADYLASQNAPNFAVGNHLPKLTRWGWNVSSNAAVELAKRWGYALELSGYMTPDNATGSLVTGTRNYGLIQLAKSDPSYKLFALLDRTFTNPPAAFFCTNAAGVFLTNSFGNQVVCPEGPDSYWSDMSVYWVDALRTIHTNAPLAIVLNGGEYGMGTLGFERDLILQDPRVQAATNGLTIYRYDSNQKAHQAGILSARIHNQLSGIFNAFYYTAEERNRVSASGEGYLLWGWNADVMIPSASDIPSFENYYGGLPSWTNNSANFGGNPALCDLLTKTLNAVGYNIALGNPTNYSWLSGGTGTDTTDFSNRTKYSDIGTYSGYLKCCYTAGMVGGIAGYFDYPSGGFDTAFDPSNPPHWLQQIATLAHVHALFSHLEGFLYRGDLLPGPNQHIMSSDQPAYEFPNSGADVYARVLSRKANDSNQWIVTSWAPSGVDRNVTVTIPSLGALTVTASSTGTVYYATSQADVHILDEYGAFPPFNSGTLILNNATFR